VSDGGVDQPRRGETRSPSFPSQSLSSSSSVRRLLVLFAGGEAISGDDRESGVWVGDNTAGAAMIGGCTRAGQSGTAVAALPRLRQRRWWQRCFLAVAVITAGVG
jgi:hypothetical protein